MKLRENRCAAAPASFLVAVLAASGGSQGSQRRVNRQPPKLERRSKLTGLEGGGFDNRFAARDDLEQF